MKPVTSEAAAWTAMLPSDAIWLSGRRSQPRPPAGVTSDQMLGPAVAVVAPPWALHGRSADSGQAGAMAYIAVPTRQHPLLVASRDPEVLRYLADSVLSVPPGATAFPSFVLTVGLRLLRYQTAWILAAVVRAADVVRVRRTG